MSQAWQHRGTPMTVSKFRAWDHHGGRMWQAVNGTPVAMARQSLAAGWEGPVCRNTLLHPDVAA